ncbi:Cys/Met metabolism pyridoxal-phosphate-dependent enzyme [Campylobacter suis]|uniref:Uncharacterized protein n=1 Tax=Campylobacter suis TaxID=2790657 RepID=A0ABM8Q1U6_9BACT|nr:Cys/Met metabolism pyridoxal-phosphate-dependent enzyme [Campylobacter suis]CAD7286746.1 hypothetical protein LMG8286_00516 [Campylobacter suis]
MTILLTTTRSPADHFISGALIAGIGTATLNLNEKDKLNLAKKTIKMSLVGGITTAVAIHASNQIARAKYLNAALSVGAGVSSVLLINSLIKEEK